MADEQDMLSTSIDDFFKRCGLDPRVRIDCDDFLEKHFPDKQVIPAQTQGYCSYTVLVDDRIIQFRPAKYALNLNVTAAAKAVYGSYAPSTASLGVLRPHGLLIYTMETIQGTSYKDFLTSKTAQNSSIRQTLCEDFAHFLARSWHRRGSLPLPIGAIGSSIPSRLRRLSQELPLRFRFTAKDTLSQLHLINTALPKVLAHGDIVPSNILLSPTTGHLHGLVDWAEAELLPFGICLYGLEEILGYINTKEDTKVLIYHADAAQCRAAFWAKLVEEIPELADETMEKAVLVARMLGILLWYGFAFDDGAIDRVVREGRDWREVCYLDALLGPGRELSRL
jgi:serine/threonine protein kinase